ncbi:hypothetical protein P280DRAFT_479349 [Massarina eburnea CBS 473.64]|uniref:Uncharacterized protein n=1 Tax=Massarina eburnea CBS 473.64 TaxID=1395130 RepID=A0A6A6S4T5_9PLEO|nr:hypothetical protein P280DRAFT_479349 [Massarina eburnea CBS 473.64]
MSQVPNPVLTTTFRVHARNNVSNDQTKIDGAGELSVVRVEIPKKCIPSELQCEHLKHLRDCSWGFCWKLQPSQEGETNAYLDKGVGGWVQLERMVGDEMERYKAIEERRQEAEREAHKKAKEMKNDEQNTGAGISINRSADGGTLRDRNVEGEDIENSKPAELWSPLKEH